VADAAQPLLLATMMAAEPLPDSDALRKQFGLDGAKSMHIAPT
jgi:hypothetical protein